MSKILQKIIREYLGIDICFKHKWRVGCKTDVIFQKSRNGKLKKILPTKQVIWCENCNKRIHANIYSDYRLEDLKRSPPQRWKFKKLKECYLWFIPKRYRNENYINYN